MQPATSKAIFFATMCNYNSAFTYVGGTGTTGIGVEAVFKDYTGINDQDQIAYSDPFAPTVLVWQNGTVTQLADCMRAGLGPECAPFGINNSGQVVGAAFGPFSGVALLFTHGAVYDLNTL